MTPACWLMEDAALGRISVLPGGVRMVGAAIIWAWVAGAVKIEEREAIKANRMVETCEFIIFMVFSQGQNRCTAIGMTENPWLVIAGKYQDDPNWDEYQAAIAEARQVANSIA